VLTAAKLTCPAHQNHREPQFWQGCREQRVIGLTGMVGVIGLATAGVAALTTAGVAGLPGRAGANIDEF